MSEYTPSDEDVRNALIDAAVGTMRGAYKRIARVETAWAFDRWLAEHDAQLVEKLIADVNEYPAVTWAGHGGMKERLRARAAEIREGAK